MKLSCSESCKAVGVKWGGLQTGLGGPVCVWEGEVVVVLVRTESREWPHVCHHELRARG